MKIIAHRGNDKIHKENTLDSIINSLNKQYIDGVEFDIRITKDNKFIINHDPFYYDLFIKKTNTKELQKLGLNTLEEVLEKINNNKIILIEVKVDDDIKKTAKYLYKILKKYNLNIYVCSFNYSFITHFHEKYKIKSGIIIGKHINTNKIINDLNFNSVSFKYKGQMPNKETFIWTINKPSELKNKINNIITDEALEIYEYINQKKS